MKTLIELYDDINKQHNHSSAGFTDKHLPYHTYLGFYENEFKNYRKGVNLLEIGVWRGGSIYLWTKYFNKYKIDGLDINASTLDGYPFREMLENDKNVKWHLGYSSTDAEYATNFKDGQFDLIVEDGAHDVVTQFETFKLYFPKLDKEGTYFIEDVLDRNALFSLRKQIEEHMKDKVILDVYEGTIGRPDDLILKIKRK